MRAFLCLCYLLFATAFMLHAQSNIVGAIPGEIDVSPVGAATYTIPIEVVPGTQGMQPNLSIVYNSFGGMGLLGMKWNLTGLSAITLCGQTPYYDGNLTAIQFFKINLGNRFALDGERLLNIDGTYGADGTVYATEIENFTRITSTGTAGNPTHFTAYTNNGTVMEYGYTTDSKQNLGKYNYTVLSWYINKITDFNGNYMTFHYGGSNGEIWIDSIKYTGNPNALVKQPYAKVKFDYIDLPDTMGRNTYFVGGYGVPQTKLLTTITVSYKDTVVRKYQFNYNTNNPDERTTHLKGIELSGEGGREKLNETTINWNNNNFSIVQQPFSGLPSNFPQGQILTGDFNGDGYEDMVVYGLNSNVSNHKKWELYLFNPSTSKYSQKTSDDYSIQYDCPQFYAHDLNGDGKDELIIIEKVNNSSTLWKCFYYTINDFGNFIPLGFNWFTNFYSIKFGDFDGNGSTDMVISAFIETHWGNDWYLSFFKWGTNNMISMGSIDGFNELKPGSILFYEILDVNGNGKKNIQVYKNGDLSAVVYEYNDSDFNIINNNYPVHRNSFYNGDVNGDGISDALVYCKENNEYKWKLLINKGNGDFIPYYLNDVLNTESSSIYPKYLARMIDINGDGKDDIIQIVYTHNPPKTTCNILLSTGWVADGYIYKQVGPITISGAAYSVSDLHVGDFNGDGKLDLLLKNDNYPPYRIIYCNQDNDYEFVQKITDGAGKKIQLHYQHTYFLTPNKKLFISIVDSLNISNGIGTGLNRWQYQFIDAAYSYPRRTFLGFNEFTCIDNQYNKKITSIFGVDSVKQVMKPISQTTYYDNTSKYETTYNFLFQEIENNRYVPYSNETTEKNLLTDTKTVTTNSLSNTGRLTETNTKTYNECNAGSWLHSETNAYTYQTIALNGNQTKTVPTQILTTQQYGSSGTVITDTTIYNYAGNGRLNWQRQGNSDRSITTSYGNYLVPGVYQQKNVSATGLSRTETYTYDDTRRFVATIKNQLNHETKFTYDAKTGNQLTETDPNGLVTTYNYDTFGNLTKITYPDNTKTDISRKWYSISYMPDVKYSITTQTTATPEVTVYYDTLGRERFRLDDGYYYETQYDSKGKVVKTSYPFGSLSGDRIWCTYTYDIYGRKLTETAPYTNLSYSYNNRNLTVTNNGVSSSKNYDALGRITQAVDEGGTIDYSYTVTNDKRHQTTITTNNTDTFIECDLWGNRLSINDPDAGEIIATYNGFNELLTQTDANGNMTAYQYDTLGRISKKIFTASDNSSQSITYVYWTTGKGSIGKLRAQVMSGAGATDSFDYDTLGRLKQYQTLFGNGGERASLNYTYDSISRLQTLKYPDNFKVNYLYTTTGKLNEIRDGNDNSLIYKVISRNKYNKPTGCEYGNGVVTEYEYDLYGLLTRIKTGKKNYDFTDPPPNDKGIGIGTGLAYWVDSTILNYRYAYNPKGLMSSRSESTINQIETYTYDDLERLLTVTAGKIGQTGTTQSLIYHNNGNILNNSAVGTYSYKTNGSNKPHAVTKVEPVSHSIISANQCDVEYNFFNQPTKIEEGDASATLSSRIELFYGVNQQRNKAMMYKDSTLASTCYYFGKYFEKEITGSTDTACRYDYIYGDNGVVALHTTSILPSTDTTGGGGDPRVVADGIYYIHTDHLGSYCALTDLNKKVVQRNYFDPWGNFKWVYKGRGDEFVMTDSLQRDTISMQPIATANFTLTTRGFTGHEHYPQFKIINMNGRLYDPVICRFFSPDNYVMNSLFTQDFNRYSYARNNPLAYTDPSGDHPILIAIAIGAAIAAASYTVNVAVSPGGFQNWNWGQFAINTVFGGIMGGMSAGIGMALTPALTSAGIGGFWSGAITGAVTGTFTGTMCGVMQYGMTGDANAIWKSALIGMGMGAGIGGLTSGIQAMKDGRTFWNGAKVEQVSFNYNIDPVLQGDKGCLLANMQADNIKNGSMFTDEQLSGCIVLGEGGYADAQASWRNYHELTGRSIREVNVPGRNVFGDEIMKGRNASMNLYQYDGNEAIHGHSVMLNDGTFTRAVRVNGTVVYRNIHGTYMNPATGAYAPFKWWNIRSSTMYFLW